MSPFLFVYSVLLGYSVITSAAGARISWQQRDQPSSRPMFILCLAILVWAVCYIFELNVTGLSAKVFWAAIKYPAVTVIPVVFAIFLLRISGWTTWPRRFSLALLLVIPALTTLIVFTNNYHHLFWVDYRVQVFPAYSSLKTTNGPWFLIHVLYSYGLLVVSATLAIITLSRTWRVFSRQLLLLSVGITLPLGINILSVLGIEPWTGIDLSPVALGVAVTILLISSGMTDILTVSPLAHIALMNQMRDGVIVLDRDNRIHELNPAAERILELPNLELVGKSMLTLDHPITEILQRYSAGKTIQRDVQLDGSIDSSWYDVRISNILTPQGEIAGRLLVLRDITERKRIENELRFTSTHDTLTGLYNRMYFDMDFERIRLGRFWPITIIMIDLDHLKKTNDTYGHTAGDELIRRAAQVLRGVFRKDDMVARIGGDEFSALLPECTAESARALIQRLYQALESSNQAVTDGPQLSFSIGCATALAGDDLSQTMAAADAQLYQEKSRRKRAEANPV